ncbi:MAG: hypothetical protein K2X81_05905, partial [Candidatus Obscuribacterales bacterium]|nr:hypothetical protein [Candidatus Obscuribacterales bacterium]
MLTFSLLAAGAACLRFGATAPQDFPYLSWTGWTIKDFMQQKERPNVVFLGSSLMLVPLDGIDADYLNKRVDGSQHHHSAYFEDKFREKTGLNLHSFTFALPGEMPSDAYLIVKNLLNGKNKPDMIVYGVGPRDFLDNTLPSPAATDPYKFLSRFGSVNPIADRVMPEAFQRLDFELGKVCYFYGQRADLSVKATHMADQTIGSVLPLPPNVKEMNADDHHLILPEFRPTEISAGQAWFRPSTPEDRKIFVDNLPEYRQRYKTLNWDTYISQMRFFADTLDEARAKGIKVVVMTMPITDLNRSLLSNLSWKAYRSGVLALAKRKGATVVDYSESKDFSQADFGDTVHLHAVGGRRL